MGKAAVDLPDPLQTPPDAGRPLTSTDDLLAQLAGEEIDRLLAEVDESTPPAVVVVSTPAPSPAPHAAPHVPPAAPVGAPFPAEGMLPPEAMSPAAAFSNLDVDSAAPDEGPAPAVDEAAASSLMARQSADLTAELDALFSAARAAPHPGTPGPAALTEDEPHGTSAAERSGLVAPSSDALAPPPRSRPAPAQEPPVATGPGPGRSPGPGPGAAEADDGALPLLLRPLEWMNAPLDACPQGVRDFIGKAAIITLVNATAILVYVLLFRRG